MTTLTGAAISFWAAALALVALAWAVLCLPVLQRRSAPRRDRPIDAPTLRQGAVAGTTPTETADVEDRAGLEHAVANAAIFAEQLAELDAGLASGRIDSSAHRAAQTEIHRRLLAETSAAPQPEAAIRGDSTAGVGTATSSSSRWRRRPGLSTVLAVALPAIAIGVYLRLGDPSALNSPVAAAVAGAPEVSAADVAAMVDKLAERLNRRPAAGAADLPGWIMLGRSYAALKRFDDAAKAFARALAISPDDPQLLADRADMLAMQQDQRLDGEPQRLIDRALALDPKQLKALALAGSAAFERRDWAKAADYWRRARAQVADGSDLAQGLDQSLAEVAAASGDGSAPTPLPSTAAGAALPAPAVAAAVAAPADGPVTTTTTTTPATRTTPSTTTASAPPTPSATVALAAPPASIRGNVRLSPGLGARVVPGDTVFVFARAAQGPRMPLAILRRTVADLPFDFVLDDSLAMSPALKLSNFADVVVGVRISRSGNAMPQTGDLIGEAIGTPGGAPVRLMIDRVQP